MITTSEWAANLTIWVLSLAGAFFGGRAAWRRRRQAAEHVRRDCGGRVKD